MVTSTSFSNAIRNAQPRFGRVEFYSTDRETRTQAIIQANTPETDDVVTFNCRKIGTSQTAKLMSQKMRNNQLSVKDLKKGLSRILGNRSDLSTESADPSEYRLVFMQTPQTALKQYNRVKDSIQQSIQRPGAMLRKYLGNGIHLGNKMIGGSCMLIGDLGNGDLATQVEQREHQQQVNQTLKRNNSSECLSLLLEENKDIYGDPISFSLSTTDSNATPLGARLIRNKQTFNRITEVLGSEQLAEDLITRIIARDIEYNLLSDLDALPDAAGKAEAVQQAKKLAKTLALQSVEQNRKMRKKDTAAEF